MNVFGILGPVMIGPSSSYTAGATRIGRITLALLGAPAMKADIFLHDSFAKTYRGHGTGKVLIAGIMDMATDDSRIRRAPELAREQGLEVSITTGEIDEARPNTARATLTNVTGSVVFPLGGSIDGGNILVKEVSGIEVSIIGQYTTLVVLHCDTPSTIAIVTEVIADAEVNICSFRLSRQSRGDEAVMTIEIDGSLGPELNEKAKVLPNIFSNTMLQPIQLMKPIIAGGIIFMELEFNYPSMASIVAATEKSGLPIFVVVLRQQTEQVEQTEELVYEHMQKNYQVMTECIDPGCNRGLKSTSGLTGNSAYKMRRISENGKNLTGLFLSGALYRALAVLELNTTMGRIVATLIAGGCGILPAALPTVQIEEQVPERDYVMSLSTASVVGMIIANNASLAGAQGGCQARCGSAAAMAAAVIAELVDDTPRVAEYAITIAIENILGLVCDPVVGLAEIPCIRRNASDVAGIFVAAEPVLVDIKSTIPTDEVIWIMKKVGDVVSSTLKEAAKGGLAATPAGGRPHEQVFGTAWEPRSGCSRCGGCSS